MANPKVLLALAVVSVALSAQVPQSRWSFGMNQFAPTFEGHLDGKQDGKAIKGDLQRDYGLSKDKTNPGASIEYQGPRFGLYLSIDSQEFAGFKRVTQEVTINNLKYPIGTDLQTNLKLTGMDFIWTIRFLAFQQSWIGVDLGAHAWGLEIDGAGTVTDPTSGLTTMQKASDKVTAPIPQIGLSAGGHMFNGRLVLSGYCRYLGYKGATYTRVGADARFFFLQWLGARAYVDAQTFKVPKDSIEEDMEMTLDRKGAGLGVVLRW